jgi:hypothetical protein
VAPPDATIEFVHPKQDEKVTDYPLFVQVNVDNFKLLPPVPYWTRIAPEDAAKGHIHYTLDDSPIYATNETQLMLGKNGGKALPVGRHVLKAELVYMNHRGLNSPAVAEISFLCERPSQGNAKDSPAVTNAGAQKQLQQIQQQIEQVQKQILQLQKAGPTSPQTVPAP